MSQEIKRHHIYHAEATALSGHIEQPLHQKIYPHAYAKLRDDGGYLSQRSENFRLSEVLSYRSAYTQVAGNLDQKLELGWSSLATSVVEGLNILDVVTIDRLVAQVSTLHPPDGYVPRVSFLGTRFENFRIAGHPVEIPLDLDLLGDKPRNDTPYIGDPALAQRVQIQHEAVGKCQDLPSDIAAKYSPRQPASSGDLSLDCSLAAGVEGRYPGRSFGHVIDVPNFGKIYLATLRLEHSHFMDGTPKKTLLDFTLLDIRMGCIGSGNVSAGHTVTNGMTQP